LIPALVRLGQRASYLSRHAAIRRQHWTKLQLGAGFNVLDGWLNTDLKRGRDVLFVDATKRLPFPDGHFEYVFSEHMIEHLAFVQGRQLLREIHRILRDGGKLRIATPDLAFLLRLYQNETGPVEREYIAWSVKTFCPDLPVCSVSVMNQGFRGWGHRYIYDEETLSRELQDCGFGKVVRYEAGQSDDPVLRGLESHGRIIGEFNNRLETLALEATKMG
jgi:predicted SAM-dependent methyltransferase